MNGVNNIKLCYMLYILTSQWLQRGVKRRNRQRKARKERRFI
jgi:hypothetical protein